MNEDERRELATCVVTVTYGDRIKFLDPVVRAAVKAGALRVVIVDNGSSASAKDALAKLASELGDVIEMVTLERNLGSAGGYKAGMLRAKKYGQCEFIWLLDDDNLARHDALEALRDAYRRLGSDPQNALLSLRQKLKQYRDASINGSPLRLRTNSFYGFHVVDIPRKVSRLVRRFFPSNLGILERIQLVRLETAAYGGFFFHRTWLDKVGYPDERLFVDQDDLEFSNRFTEAGGSIHLCSASELDDIDLSWYNERITSHRWLAAQANEARVYLLVRNHAYINKGKVRNPLVYWINKNMFISALWLFGWLREPKKQHLRSRFRLIRRAIDDGERGNLGPGPFA